MKLVAIVGIVLLFAAGTEAAAQRRVEFEFGVRAGVPINMPLRSESGEFGQAVVTQSVEKPGFVAGPMFGVVLYDRLIVQFDSLYKPLRVVSDTTTTVAAFTGTTRGGLWEFPLVFDYRFFNGPVRPYAGAGMVLGQLVSATTETRGAFTETGREIHNHNQFFLIRQFPAYVVNAGLEWNASHLRMRPEVRYTRWDDGVGSPKRKQNQFEFLIGFSLNGSSQ
jgi:opacity protein-like surface antigen